MRTPTHDAFYTQLFAPVEQQLGTLDPETLMALIGFDAGGPVNFCTFGRSDATTPTTYLTCELAVRRAQRPSPLGRYELMYTGPDEDFARDLLTNVGRMSLEVGFGPGHTLDIGPWVDQDYPVQGVAFEEFARVPIPSRWLGVFPWSRTFGILVLHPMSRTEVDRAAGAAPG